MTQAGRQTDERFDVLFRAHAADIAAYCRWRLQGRPHDAEDALADVFLTAWRRVEEIPGDERAARIWLYATARRVTANQLRSIRRRIGLLDRLFSHTSKEAFEVGAGDAPTIEAVGEALRTLSRRDQEVLLLAEWEQLASAEIAGVIGCSETAARGRLHRARKRFRAAYERQCDAETEYRTHALGDEHALDRLQA